MCLQRFFRLGMKKQRFPKTSIECLVFKKQKHKSKMQNHCVSQRFCNSNLCFSLLKYDFEGMSKLFFGFLNFRSEFPCKTQCFCNSNLCFFLSFLSFLSFFQEARAQGRECGARGFGGGGPAQPARQAASQPAIIMISISIRIKIIIIILLI